MPVKITRTDGVDVFREVVRRVVPEDATVVVVSRGDGELLKLEGRTGWHFPQRSDGVYAGYYPPDGAAAVKHLEALRERGADFLAFPASALWWLEHYSELADHLEAEYEQIVHHEEAGAVFALVEDSSYDLDAEVLDFLEQLPEPDARVADPVPEPEPDPEHELPDQLDEHVLSQLRTIFDAGFYADQAERTFTSEDAALAHYLADGHVRELSPHVLFDERWYHERYPEVRESGQSGLEHFLRNSTQQRQDPNPYFDTAYYYGQHPDLPERGENALLHYVLNAPSGNGGRTNPLFHDSYYRQTYRDAHDSALPPLEHFLRMGATQGRYGSHHHKNIFDRLRQSSLKTLIRGNWKQGSALVFTDGARGEASAEIDRLIVDLAETHRLDVTVVQYRRAAETRADAHAKVLVLQDYQMACEIFRPSALRMLARTLWRLAPALVVSDVTEVLPVLRDSGIGTYYVGPAPPAAAVRSDPDQALAKAMRIKLPKKRMTNSRALLKQATTDLGLDPLIASTQPAQRKQKVSRLVIACSDWTVSGVNAAMQAVGTQLIERGWDVEIVFTRDEEFVRDSAKGADLPTLPYRFLHRPRSGLDGMWEALIAEVERTGPSILFLTYDQVANCVVPALTDSIGVLSWMQADDGDYYEQAYRLGRYCNAIVCVSAHIRDNVLALNPALGARTHVIHNTSVREREIARRRRPRGARIKLVYTGRLVQYQKRILDFTEFAHALDRTGVPYELSLIGEFATKEGIQHVFEDAARAHLEDGRIRLLGRLPRDEIFEELRRNAFFLLLSDFEGLPLSLVEGMAAGCVPIVAEMPSGIPELITHGDDGLIVSGRDYDAWAQMLTTLWGDGDRLAAMSRNARSTVRRAFTVEKIGKEFHDLVTSIADEIESGRYSRPPSLNWGSGRSTSGDVLPSPNLFLPQNFANYPGLRGVSGPPLRPMSEKDASTTPCRSSVARTSALHRARSSRTRSLP